MNIFIISRGYPTKQDPTWGCFEKDQAKALTELGHKVTILSVDTRFRKYWRPIGIQTMQENGLLCFNIFLFPYSLLFFIPKQIKEAFYAWQLELIYKRAVKLCGKPDVLYSHYIQNTEKATFIKRKHNIPLVAIEHWSKMGYHPIPEEIIRTAKNVYPKTNQLLTVSSALQKNIQNQVGTESIVVPNMVSRNYFYKPKSNTSNTIKIVTTGRLIPEKHFDMLIEALANINHPFELNIIGNGPYREQLQECINKNKMQQCIRLLGFKTQDEIVSILQDSDLFVLPSQSETFGVAYVEALACGLPIIATDCGGPRDIVRPQNGLIIPVNDLAALENSINYVIENISKYDGKAIAKDCQLRFSPEVIAKQLTSIFEDVIKTHKK